MGVLRTDAWNELNFGPVYIVACPGCVFLHRAQLGPFREKSRNCGWSKRLSAQRVCSAACNMQCWAGDRSTVLGNGIFWGTKRAIKPENGRFQLRTLGTGWSMKKVKKICFGTAGKAWKGGLKGRTYLYCHYTWVPPPPGFMLTSFLVLKIIHLEWH